MKDTYAVDDLSLSGLSVDGDVNRLPAVRAVVPLLKRVLISIGHQGDIKDGESQCHRLFRTLQKSRRYCPIRPLSAVWRC